jgi:hypothetical protein
MNVKDLIVAWVHELGYTKFTYDAQRPHYRIYMPGHLNTLYLFNTEGKEVAIYGLVTNDSQVSIGWHWTAVDEDEIIDLAEPDILERIKERYRL